MATDQKPASPTTPPTATRGPSPVSAAVRQRLQKMFEHAQRCVEKADYDYAHQLYTQCVAEDPGNLTYVQACLSNLHEKYNNNKKGAKLASLKIKSHRSAFHKAAERGEWLAAFQAACGALAVNPWDVPTLLAMAEACRTLHADECQLYYLRCALDFDHKDPIVNRQAAIALQRMGQFDQAIACWHRVEQAKKGDEEALQSISRLSVEKTIQHGGYDPELLKASGGDGAASKSMSVARLAKGGAVHDPGEIVDASVPLEQRLRDALAKDPAAIDSYLRLADLYLHDHRLDEAQEILDRAQQATGGGDLNVRERLEELQLRRAVRQAAAAQAHFDHEQTPEARQLLDRARTQANQVELEVYATRADRNPKNTRLQFELALRLKRAGKLREAIAAFQAAREEPKRKALVLLELGECFQKIEQYKLALSHYEQAVEACEPGDLETRKLALYRTGILATGLRELDLAERRLSELAGLDFGFRDVADRLDKVTRLRDKE